MVNKKIFRSTSDKMISGVCGGIAAYLGCDSNLIRLLYLLLTVFSAGFPGVLCYILLSFILPKH